MFSEPYARHFDQFYHAKPYKRDIEFLWAWAHQPKRILDLGCGTAQYWRYYPPSVELVGIDQSPEMIAHSPYKDRIFCHDLTTLDPWFQTKPVDCVTALFDVLNYLPHQAWWKYLPLKRDGYLLFDVWNTDQVRRDGFHPTVRMVNGCVRTITPVEQTDHKVRLQIVLTSSTVNLTEVHDMYLYDFDDIVECAGAEFDVLDVKRTDTWQMYYKLKRK